MFLVSNYAIREDDELIDGGNFPVWAQDFLANTGKSRYSHILDFDILRLGKKLVKDNERAGSFEFGVVAISRLPLFQSYSRNTFNTCRIVY